MDLHDRAGMYLKSLVENSAMPLNKDELPPLRGYLEGLVQHAPSGWLDELPQMLSALNAVVHSVAVPVIVVAADITCSSSLIDHSEDFEYWGGQITEFFGAARDTVWKLNGFFDKFTGDGFLAYWPLFDTDKNGYPVSQDITADVLNRRFDEHVFETCDEVMWYFYEHTLPNLANRTQRFTHNVGLSIGVATGEAMLLQIAGDLTLVGPPVVLAVRLETAAERRTVLVDHRIGCALIDSATAASRDLQIEPMHVQTKDSLNTIASYKIAWPNLEGLPSPGSVVSSPIHQSSE